MSRVYLANWIQERKTINPARNISAHWHYQAHVSVCAERQIRIWRRYKAWVDKWPDYCDKCGAWGVLSWEENQSPIGSGQVWMMPMHDACDACVASEEMVCPRCGKSVIAEVLRPRVPGEDLEGDEILLDTWLDAECECPICGWEWGNNPEDTAPMLMEEPCGCERGYGELPGKWQRWVFERFGERFQGLFVYPIRIMIEKEDRNG